jgi:hypothetical protein
MGEGTSSVPSKADSLPEAATLRASHDKLQSPACSSMNGTAETNSLVVAVTANAGTEVDADAPLSWVVFVSVIHRFVTSVQRAIQANE